MIYKGFVSIVVISVTLGLFAYPMVVIAQEPLATTHTLQALVAKWVDLRREAALEKENWDEQKAQLEQERSLLLKEKKMLEEEIVQARKEQTQVETERVELLQGKEVSQKVLDECLPAITRAEANLKKWQVMVPPSLSASLSTFFDRLPRASGKSVSQRLQVILSIYGEIERLQHNVHIVKETLKTDSDSLQEMDVIYLGLTQGFAVSQDNKIAGISLPSPDGWKWQWKNEIAPEVRKAIAFYRREQMADFVHLPLKITEVSQ